MKENWISLLESEFDFKEYHQDMIYDFFIIINNRLSLFNENLETFEVENAKNFVEYLIPYCKNPKQKHRMYIVSGIKDVLFAWNDFDDYVMRELDAILKLRFTLIDKAQAEMMPSDLLITMYICTYEKMKIANILPSDLIWFAQRFSKYNLANHDTSL